MRAIAFHHQMIRTAALVTVVITAASSCVPSSGTRSTASPARPSPTDTPSNGLLVLITPTGNQSRYGIEIVGLDGAVVASATASVLTHPMGGPGPPPVVTTNDRVYFRDGDTTIRWLAQDGSTGDAITVSGAPTSRAGFAVSPDDTRIAVAALQYRLVQQTPVAVQSLRLYVQALGGDKKSTDIFTSTTDAEWPIGWHADTLVIAVSVPHAQYAADNPYGAYDGYNVVDPLTGTRVVEVCYLGMPEATPVGPAVPAGTLCGNYVTASDWNGRRTTFAVPQGTECAALSPAGDLAACTSEPSGLSGVGSILVYRPNGLLVSSAGSGGSPAWVDESHIAFSSAGPEGYARVCCTEILALRSGSVTHITVPGEFVGILPGAL